MRLQPHRARYRILDAAGATAGHEQLSVERSPGGFHLTSSLRTTYPAAVEVELQWQLDADLVTRLLYIHSRDAWGEEYEIEATVTGNGMLAHRSAPGGPTQVELGWGPAVEFDYISAAFPAVIMARTFSSGATVRGVDAVELGVEDLVPVVVVRSYRRASGQSDGITARCVTAATGHVALIEVAPSGMLRRYEGLLELEAPAGEPTK
ncbi:MAG TPA: hypothetical protein VIN56_08205, partial [Candidatus Dormibacteraeota bacterium]